MNHTRFDDSSISKREDNETINAFVDKERISKDEHLDFDGRLNEIVLINY